MSVKGWSLPTKHRSGSETKTVRFKGSFLFSGSCSVFTCQSSCLYWNTGGNWHIVKDKAMLFFKVISQWFPVIEKWGKMFCYPKSGALQRMSPKREDTVNSVQCFVVLMYTLDVVSQCFLSAFTSYLCSVLVWLRKCTAAVHSRRLWKVNALWIHSNKN